MVVKRGKVKFLENDALFNNYSKLIAMMRKGNLIKDYKMPSGRVVRNSFRGGDLVSWIMKETRVKRDEAMETGQDLIDKHFALVATKEHGPTFSVDRQELPKVLIEHLATINWWKRIIRSR